MKKKLFKEIVKMKANKNLKNARRSFLSLQINKINSVGINEMRKNSAQ